MNHQVELCDLRVLKHHEEIDPERLSEVRRLIEGSAVWTYPIVVEREHGIILDGHHRFEVARSLGLRRIPVVLVNYFDESIQVQPRRDIRVGKQDVIEQAKLRRVPYPHKTTQHTWNGNGSSEPVIAMVPEVSIPLTELR